MQDKKQALYESLKNIENDIIDIQNHYVQHETWDEFTQWRELYQEVVS